MAALFALLFFLTVIAVFALFVFARRARAQTGLPYGARVVYADTGAWKQIERPLFSQRYGLTGKPDYIVKDHGATIPVEVKPNRVATAPRESDTLQLAAYALLIEEQFGATPAYGLLKYRDVVFQVELTNELRARLLETVAAMRRNFTGRDIARSHTNPRQCRACGYRGECGQSL
jgi:CRISPR-associated exonuclease Cas4